MGSLVASLRFSASTVKYLNVCDGDACVGDGGREAAALFQDFGQGDGTAARATESVLAQRRSSRSLLSESSFQLIQLVGSLRLLRHSCFVSKFIFGQVDVNVLFLHQSHFFTFVLIFYFVENKEDEMRRPEMILRTLSGVTGRNFPVKGVKFTCNPMFENA